MRAMMWPHRTHQCEHTVRSQPSEREREPQAQPRLKSWRGPRVGWMPIPLPFPPSPPLPVIASPIPFPTLLSFSRYILQGGLRSTVSFPHWPAKNDTQLQKLIGRDQIHLVPVISKVAGDASHGSYRVDARLWRGLVFMRRRDLEWTLCLYKRRNTNRHTCINQLCRRRLCC